MRRPFRPRFEQLEDRSVPATHVWSGAVNANWSTAGNWSSGGVPTSNEAGGTIVEIPIDDLTINQNIPNLTIAELRFTNPGSSTLTLVEPLTINTNAAPNNIVSNGGTNHITGGSIPLTSAFPQMYVDVAAGTLTIDSTISGAYGVNKYGAGVLLFNGANTYTGTTTIFDGTLAVDGNQNQNRLVANAQVVVNNGGTFEVRGNNALPIHANAVDVAVNSGGTLRVVSGGSAALGAGGESHAHLRNITLDSGAVRLAYSGTGTAFDTANFTLKGTLSVTASSQISFDGSANASTGGVQLNGSHTISVAAGAFLTVAAELQDEVGIAGAVEKVGTGTLVLNAANTYTGLTSVTSGTLQVIGTGAFNRLVPNAQVAVSTGAVFEVASENPLPSNANAIDVVLDGGTYRLTGAANNGGHVRNIGFTNGGRVETSGTVGSFHGYNLFLSGNVLVNGSSATPATIDLQDGLGVSGGRTFDVADITGSPASDLLVTRGGIINESAGAVTKTGTGTMVLAANSNYTGTTTISAGTLQIGTGGTTGTLGTGAVVNTGTLTFNRSDSFPVSNNITGVGGNLVLAGGTMTLTGSTPNTYTGTTTITNGTLVLNTTMADAAISGTIVVGDNTGAAGSAVLRLAVSQQVPFPATITVNADGRLEQNGSENFAAMVLGSATGGGTVTIGPANSLGIVSGTVTTVASPTGSTIGGTTGSFFPGGAVLTVANGSALNDLTITSFLQGSGGLTKAGAGRLTITNDSTFGFTGTIVMQSGDLVVNGQLPSNPVTMTGGFVGGNGVVGPITATGGVVVPGLLTAPATFASGSLSLSNGAAFLPLVTAAAADRLNVTGTVTLTGAVFDVQTSGSPVTNGTVYTLISNDGTDAVVGTFNGLPEGATVTVGTQTFRISYQGGDGNDVTLTAPPAATTTTTTLASSQNPSVVGQSVTFTATVTAASGTPTGTVTFFAGGVSLGTVALDANGRASFSGPFNAAGTYSPFAIYNGSAGTFLASTSSPLTQVVRASSLSGLLLISGPINGMGVQYARNPASNTFDQPQPVLLGVANVEQHVAMGDVNGDGVLDRVSGTGFGVPATVLVFTGTNGEFLAQLNPFGEYFGGVFVTTGDLNGDGRAEIVVTPDAASAFAGPVDTQLPVVVYDGATFAELARFDGLASLDGASGQAPGTRLGGRAAVADVNGDGVPDLMVSAGTGGGPRITIWNGTGFAGAAGGKPTTNPLKNLFVFEETQRGGAFAAAGDIDGDGFAELIAGGGPGGGPRVRVVNGNKLFTLQDVPSNLDDPTNLSNGLVMNNFFGGSDQSRGGVRVTVKDVDGDARADIVTGSGAGDASAVNVYLASALVASSSPSAYQTFDPFGETLPGGVWVG